MISRTCAWSACRSPSLIGSGVSSSPRASSWRRASSWESRWGEVGDALAAGLLRHRSLFEGAEVAVERLVQLSLFGVETVEFGLSFRAVGVEAGPRS